LIFLHSNKLEIL